MKIPPSRLLLFLGAAAAAALVGCSRPADAPSDSDGPTVRVARRELAITVRGSGEIQAFKSHAVIPQLKRAATISAIVPEGTRVTNGQVVAQFNTQDVLERRQDLETQLADELAKLENARSDLEIQRIENDTALSVAELNLRSAEMEQEKLEKGDAPLDRRAAALKVQTTQSDAGRKGRRYEDTRKLLEEGFVTEDQVEEERIGMEQAKVAAETAQVEAKILDEYTQPLKRATVEGALAKARSEREKARRNTATLLRMKTQAVEAARLTAEHTQREIEERNSELTNMVVRAPTAGVVTYGDPRQPWRRGEIDVGAQIMQGQVLVTIPDMSKMQALLDIPEATIFRIATNQPVTISAEALPGVTFSGTVTRIAQVANPQNWLQSDVKQFKVDAALAEGRGLKPGFSCDAEILTGRLTNCLVAPLQAVFREDDQFVVYRRRGSRAERTPVEIGESSETHVQLTAGVAEGDELLLVAPRAKAKEAGVD
jgi:HlyD family secretion protein